MPNSSRPAKPPRPLERPATPARHVIEIPNWRPATINELTKVGNHWTAAARKKTDRKMVAAYVLRDGTPKATGRRRVSLSVTLAGRMKVVDPDALWKSTLDALKNAGMLVDDSPAWLEMGTVEQEKGPAKATRIILEELPP